MTNSEFSFNESELKFYQENGFVRSRRPVFDGEKFSEIERLTSLIVNRNPAPGESVHVYHLLYKVPSFLDFIVEDRVLDMAESLLGPNLGLLSSSAFIKLPSSSSRFNWHIDFNQTEQREQISKIKTSAMLLAVTPSTVETGCLQYIPGSHKYEGVRKYKSPPADTNFKGDIYYGLEDDEVDLSKGIVNLELPKGYCSFHDLHVIHGSQPNTGREDRILLNFWFFSTDLNHVSADAIACFAKGKKGRIHLRGRDDFNVCEHSIVG